MARVVLDSWGLIAFFEDEPAGAMVEKLLLDAENGKHHLLLCILGWCDIYTAILSRLSQKTAEEKMRQIAELPVEVVGIGDDLELVRQAAIYKATFKLATACAFAGALAKLRKASLVTGDPAFRALEDEFKIQWLA